MRFIQQFDGQSGTHTTIVQDGQSFCSCADAQYRKRECKHIVQLKEDIEYSSEIA